MAVDGPEQVSGGGGGGWAGAGPGCGAGAIRGGPPAGARGRGSGAGGPLQIGPCLGPDLLCQRGPRGSGLAGSADTAEAE